MLTPPQSSVQFCQLEVLGEAVTAWMDTLTAGPGVNWDPPGGAGRNKVDGRQGCFWQTARRKWMHPK